MSRTNAYKLFLDAKVAPKEQRIFVRKQYNELKKQAEFWQYLNLVWKKYQQKQCYYCGCRLRISPNTHFKTGAKREWEIDHKLAIYYGGTNAPSNFCVACKPCNREKSADLMERDIMHVQPNKLLRTKMRRTGKIYF